MPALPSLNSRSASATITASSFNSDFAAIKTWADNSVVHTDVSKTISVTHTYSATQTFTGGATFGAATTVSTGGFTVTAGGLTVTAGGITVTAGASTFGAAVTVTGTCTATTFSGSGASLTNIPAANITGTLPAISGANLTTLNATNIASGTLATARLPNIITVGQIEVSTVITGTLVASGEATVANLNMGGVTVDFTPAATQILSATEAIADLDYVHVGSFFSNETIYFKVVIDGQEYRLPLYEVS
jgi:hypothetical protein